MRLKEAFATVTKEKSAVVEENKLLKETLTLHGIVWPPTIVTNYENISNPPTLSSELSDQFSNFQLQNQQNLPQNQLTLPSSTQTGMVNPNYGLQEMEDQTRGVDFVLA